MYTILVMGAGYAGSKIARYFREKKQKVIAVTRTGSRREEFEQSGIVSLSADLEKPETLEALPPAHFIVLAPAPDTHGEDAYERIYSTGIKNFLVSRSRKMRPQLLVYLSSTSVWRDRQGARVDETQPPDPDTKKGEILAAAEETVLGSGIASVVFRLAGIYGPGRNRVSSFLDGQWPASSEDRYVNMIHRDDIAQAMPVLFKKAEAGRVYTGVDDEPALVSEIVQWLAQKTGKSPAHSIERNEKRGKRCSNRSLKELGYRFLYPTFREGYEALLKGHLTPP